MAINSSPLASTNTGMLGQYMKNKKTATTSNAASGNLPIKGNVQTGVAPKANPLMASSADVLGVRAASPAGNMQTPANTIDKSFAAPVEPKNTNTSIQNGAVNPMANTNKQTGVQVGTPTTPTAPTAPTQPTFGGLVGALVNTPTQNQDVIKARENLQNLQNQYAETTAQIGGTPGLGQQQAQGQQGLLQQLFAAKQTSAQAALSNALQSQQLQQSALTSAAGFAAPVQLPYSVQYTNPLTGQPLNAAGGTGLAASIPDLAQQVASGKMTPDQANSYLGNTVGLTDRLRQEVLRLNPNYNFTLGSASAQTQAQGQQISTSANAAFQALDTLQNSFNNLTSLQSTNVPLVNQITQGISMATGIGREQASAYQGALNEARAQIQTVLSPLIGVDSARSSTLSLLPDNMIPSEIPAKIQAAKEYIQQRVDAFMKSGQQPTPMQENPGMAGTAGKSDFSYENFWGPTSNG